MGGSLQRLGSAGRAVGGQNLACRQQQRLLHVADAPLGAGVKDAQSVNFVVKKIAPDGVLRLRRKHVQYAAPQGELPRTLHLLAAGVARVGQTAAQGGHVVPLPHLQNRGGLLQHLRRQAPLAQRLGSGEEHGGGFRLHPVQGGNAPVVPLAAGHGGGTQVHLPPRQMQGLASGEALHIGGKALALPFVGAQKQQRPPHGLRQSGRQLHPMDGGQSGDSRAHAAVQLGFDVLHFRQKHQLLQEPVQIVPLLSEYSIIES